MFDFMSMFMFEFSLTQRSCWPRTIASETVYAARFLVLVRISSRNGKVQMFVIEICEKVER